MEFREDRLQLLGPSPTDMTPDEFYNRIVGLYSPRVTGGKAKESLIKGKKIKSATKKSFGMYEMRYPTALGERVLSFTFCKRQLFREDHLKTAADYLLCAEQKLRDFLGKKNFAISACSDESIALQEIIIVKGDSDGEKKGTNASSSN